MYISRTYEQKKTFYGRRRVSMGYQGAYIYDCTILCTLVVEKPGATLSH